MWGRMLLKLGRRELGEDAAEVWGGVGEAAAEVWGELEVSMCSLTDKILVSLSRVG